MREPAFWWRQAGICSALLKPLSFAYGTIAGRRMAMTGAAARMPVICVGNFTVGGAGKTPTAIMLARMLAHTGQRPLFLSRGYGGAVSGPKLVDLQADTARDVGDEPLLLARTAPTIVARDRSAGAALAHAQGATVLILDDGLQNPSLTKDIAIAVVDARRGIGNGLIFPAGPLRAPLEAQLSRTHALLVIGGGDGARQMIAKAHAHAIPVFNGHLAPNAGAVEPLRARRALAFAGIGDPEKFFATAEAAGIVVAQRRGYSDHHRYSAAEAADLIAQSQRDDLLLLTTEKDRARMTGEPQLETLAAQSLVLAVSLTLDRPDDLLALVKSRIAR